MDGKRGLYRSLVQSDDGEFFLVPHSMDLQIKAQEEEQEELRNASKSEAGGEPASATPPDDAELDQKIG
jgi:hypothetical protein